MRAEVRTVVILHGYEGNGPTHWQTWLADELPPLGIIVRYPRLPEPFAPDLDRWRDALDVVLAADQATGRVVVAHSLACHLWAHVAADATMSLADRAVLVAPPGRAETTETFPDLPPGPLDADTLALAATRTDVVLGAGDSWRSDATDFRTSGLLVRVVPDGKHLNTDAGFGPWPELRDWVVGRGPGPGVAG